MWKFRRTPLWRCCLSMTKTSLYVHVPFCRSRCRYCDFVSTAGLSRDWQERYRRALLQEFALYRDGVAFETGMGAEGFATVYFGGGTPTFLDDDILEAIFTGLPLRHTAEFTVEANPGTVTGGKLALLREAGCNRLSIGAQSFDDRRLAWLGRSHSAAGFRSAWESARAAGFINMNLDLLYGLPEQSLEDWRVTLGEALACKPEHVSLYQLNIEDGTPLARMAAAGEPCEADEETCRRQYLLAHQVLSDAGYLHYEISNYALPGYESRHNTHYWRNGYYLGLGAGAAGYLPGFRYTNKAGLEAYVADTDAGYLPVDGSEAIDSALAWAEELMLAFRMREGVRKERFRHRVGVDPQHNYAQILDKHLEAGLLEEDGEGVYPTLEGWLQYNNWVHAYM